MAGFNTAEKKHANYIEGILASGNIHNFTNKRSLPPLDAPDFEDEDNFAHLIYADYGFISGSFDVCSTLNQARPFSKHTGRAWQQLVFDVFLPEVSNDNCTSGVNDSHRVMAGSTQTAGIGVHIGQDLSRLVEGWAGEGSVAPSDEVIRDLLSVLTLLPPEVVEPDTEVDPDDGSVVLRWLNADATASFSLTFFGKGEVSGYLSSASRMPAWKYRVSDTPQLTGKLTSEEVFDLVTG